MNERVFERFLVVKKGFQAITVGSYVGTAKRFTKIVGKYPTIDQAMEYIQRIYTSDYSYSHKLNTALGVEQYMLFIGQPVSFGRQKKPKPMLINTLTEAEIGRIICSCRNIKEKAIISLLAYSGIRNSELCNLKTKDFLVGENAIRVINGKGLKDGVSSISIECTSILLEYIRAFEIHSDDYLFKTYQNNQFTGFALRKLVKVVAKKAKLGKRVYPHLFRHSLAVNLLLRGAHIVLLQKQLRHSLLETTLTYINSIAFWERNDYDKFVPNYL